MRGPVSRCFLSRLVLRLSHRRFDLSDVGFAGELATGPSAAAYPDSDGDNLLIVDDGGDCPNAEYPTIQAAVNAADPGDRIKVCPAPIPSR